MERDAIGIARDGAAEMYTEMGQTDCICSKSGGVLRRCIILRSKNLPLTHCPRHRMYRTTRGVGPQTEPNDQKVYPTVAPTMPLHAYRPSYAVRSCMVRLAKQPAAHLQEETPKPANLDMGSTYLLSCWMIGPRDCHSPLLELFLAKGVGFWAAS